MMKVLVTGASGFVGGWLVRRLREENVQVVVLRRKSSSNKSDIEGVETAWGDITDPASVISAAKGIDTVFHLAGHIGYSRAERDLMEKINVGGTRHVIDACRANGVRRLVHMSSVVAVGASFDGEKPLDESSSYNLHHLNLGYFETKRRAEELVIDSVKNSGLDAVMLNPSTIYGPGDAAKGSRRVQLKVAQGRFNFYTGGGVSIVGIEEVAEAIVAAWKRGRKGERYILSGDNITIQRLFEIIAISAGVRPPRIYLPDPLVRAIGKTGDLLERMGRKGPLNSESAWSSILYHWFDHRKAAAELGFKPQEASAAIGKSVQWVRERGLVK